ncbi:hypothetical protein EAY48_22270 [Escherichia coli]|nr:hypothetical protein [Escherichia coli]EFN4894551.1 hypothetical protein [Escherichia coli]
MPAAGHDFSLNLLYQMLRHLCFTSVMDSSVRDFSVTYTGEPVAKVCYAQMVKQFLSRDPFECVLCGCRMVYRRAIAGLNVSGLKKNARDISLLRYMPA